MEEFRLKISPALRAAMSYKKCAGPVPRILVLKSDYWLDIACLHAAAALGWETVAVPVRLEGQMSREMIAEMLRAIMEFQPDFILAINQSGMDYDGIFARLFEDLQVPYVAWFVDDPRTILMGRSCYASPYAIGLTWESAYVDYLISLGFCEVKTLPLAADTNLFDAEVSDVWELPPTFIGSSMTQYALDEWAWLTGHPELAIALQVAFEEGRVTRENFGRGLEAILNPGLVKTLDVHQKRHAEMYCFIEGTRRLRLNTMIALEPEGVGVRGDDGWRQHLSSAQTFVNYREELPAYYRACEVNLNTTSIQMPTAANQRVFDCPAAGGFLLTDAQTSLDALFDPVTEIAVYHSMEECVDLLRFFRAHPSARKTIAENARRRILAEHTYAHRLKTIVAMVQSRFGG